MKNVKFGNIEKFAIHFVGNKTNGEGVNFSDNLINFTKIESPIKKLLVNNFKLEELYNFYFIPHLELNPIFQFVKNIFENKNEFVEQSKNCARYLYDMSIHPQIKSGELCLLYFNDCEFHGNVMDCISIFKSENKDTFLKIHTAGDKYEIESESGININKLDKGCLIFNTEKENGYVVAIVDNTNKGAEAKYWTDNFLHVRRRKDCFNQTQYMLSICKNFVSQLPNENGKIEKVTYMNRSIDALKEESVNINTFAEKVFEIPHLVSDFKQYKEIYQKERDIEIDQTFTTASTAIKRKSVVNMTTIKLDKNFDINIHGGEQYIERGYDEERGMYYYKLFFKEEK